MPRPAFSGVTMAQEITVSGSLAAKKGTLPLSYPVSGKFNQAGIGGKIRQQSIPTTAGGTAIDMTGITNPGWILMLNKDPTNFIQVGPLSAGAMVPCMRLEPLEPAGPFRIDGTLRALSDTAACLLEYEVLEA